MYNKRKLKPTPEKFLRDYPPGHGLCWHHRHAIAGHAGQEPAVPPKTTFALPPYRGWAV